MITTFGFNKESDDALLEELLFLQELKRGTDVAKPSASEDFKEVSKNFRRE